MHLISVEIVAVHIAVADLRGRHRRPRGPNSFIFMQFSARKLQNNRLAHPSWELAHPLQENPGYATALLTLSNSDIEILLVLIFNGPQLLIFQLFFI